MNRTIYRYKVIAYAGILILSIYYIFSLFRIQLRNDIRFKFNNPRYWEMSKMNEFIENQFPNNELIYLNSNSFPLSLLNMGNWWDKKIYTICNIDEKSIQNGLNRYIYIADNKRIMNESRDVNAIKVFFPQNSFIVLTNEHMNNGMYEVKMVDNNITEKEINDIIVIADIKQINQRKTILLEGWNKKVVSINYPMNNAYPKLLTPWHSYAVKKYEKKEIRKVNKFTCKIKIISETNKIYLYNKGEDKYINGTISIYRNGSNSRIYKLDLDWGKTSNLKNKASMYHKNREHPLIWAFPNIGMHDNLMKKELFKLEGNFFKKKIFTLYNDLKRDEIDIN